MNRIIFEPVLLNAETNQEISPTQSARTSYQDGLQAPFNNRNNPDNDNDNDNDNRMFSRQELESNIDLYQAQVNAIESDSGPFSTGLYESLLDLARQYQQLGDHEEAIEHFERAEYVSRINHGLFHPEQFASIEGLIESLFAIGETNEANNKQQYLVYLNEQYFGKSNLNTLPSLIRMADHSMDIFSQSIGMPKAPVIRFNSSNQAGGANLFNPAPPAPAMMAFGNLFQAQQNYFRAISTMLDNQQYFDPDLLALEYNFIETVFLQSFRSSILNDPDYYLSVTNNRTGSLIRSKLNRRNSTGYKEGKNAFERMLIYILNNPEADTIQLTSVLLEYGDWNMLFGHTKEAMIKYREASELMLTLEIEQARIDQMIRPAIPVHLPLITAKPNSREKFGIAAEKVLEYDGYIDIAFTISRFGRAKKFEILGRSEKASKAIERRLRKYLRNSPFRPELDEDGNFNSSQITLRYYFTFATQTI